MNVKTIPVRAREHESEGAVLAHVMSHPDRAAAIFNELSPALLDHAQYQSIAWFVWELRRLGIPWDLAMLAREFKKATIGEGGVVNAAAVQVESAFYELISRNTDAITPQALQEHVRRVRAAAEKRKLHRLLVQCTQQITRDDAQVVDVITRIEDFRKAQTRGSALGGQLDDCLRSNVGLQQLEHAPRPLLMGDFFREGDLGFIYAPRGAGKTWLAMLLANARTRNEALGRWTAGERLGRVLYVDGEMHLEDTKMRSAAIGSHSEDFLWLHGDLVHEQTQRAINFCEQEWQDLIIDLCKKRGVTEVYLDNLSCLVRGMSENDNDDWRELVFPWLLELRRRKVAVVIVAHAGRQEHMRGASGKEDAAQWVLKLKPAEEEMLAQGATFITEFTKSRNTRGTPPNLLWHLRSADGGPLSVSCEIHGGVEVLVHHILGGVTKNRELAELMGVVPGTVSKLAKKAVEAGRIVIRGGLYYPAEVEGRGGVGLVA